MQKTYPLKPRLVPLFGLLSCILLVMTALPRFSAALYLLYPQQIDRQYRRDGSSISLNQHLESALAIKKALQWNESAEAWQRLSIAQAHALQDTRNPTPALLHDIYHSIRSGLRLSPIDPYNWYRLAVAEQTLHHPDAKIINALRVSVYAGRVEPGLLLKRIRLLHAYRQQMDEEMQTILQDQIRLAGLLRFRDLLQLAHEQPSLIPSIAKSLQYDPEIWHSFLQSLDKLTRNTQVNSSPQER